MVISHNSPYSLYYVSLKHKNFSGETDVTLERTTPPLRHDSRVLFRSLRTSSTTIEGVPTAPPSVRALYGPSTGIGRLHSGTLTSRSYLPYTSLCSRTRVCGVHATSEPRDIGGYPSPLPPLENCPFPSDWSPRPPLTRTNPSSVRPDASPRPLLITLQDDLRVSGLFPRTRTRVPTAIF